MKSWCLDIYGRRYKSLSTLIKNKYKTFLNKSLNNSFPNRFLYKLILIMLRVVALKTENIRPLPILEDYFDEHYKRR